MSIQHANFDFSTDGVPRNRDLHFPPCGIADVVWNGLSRRILSLSVSAYSCDLYRYISDDDNLFLAIQRYPLGGLSIIQYHNFNGIIPRTEKKFCVEGNLFQGLSVEVSDVEFKVKRLPYSLTFFCFFAAFNVPFNASTMNNKHFTKPCICISMFTYKCCSLDHLSVIFHKGKLFSHLHVEILSALWLPSDGMTKISRADARYELLRNQSRRRYRA